MSDSVIKNWLRISLLLAAVAVSSGYRFRCWAFCTDQTSTQNDYIEQRDRCRQYASLKADVALRNNANPSAPKSRQEALVSMFSECMAQNGWDVPNGKDPNKDKGHDNNTPPIEAIAAQQRPMAAATAGVPGVPAAAVVAVDRSPETMALRRKSECAFARQAAKHSSNAAARAKACDVECAERMKAAPDAPRPAACPTEQAPALPPGKESTE